MKRLLIWLAVGVLGGSRAIHFKYDWMPPPLEQYLPEWAEYVGICVLLGLIGYCLEPLYRLVKRVLFNSKESLTKSFYDVD